MTVSSIKRRLSQIASLAPQARTASANGTSADLSAYMGSLVLWSVGTITDGTHTPKLQDSPDNATWTDVAAGFLEGSFAALATGVNQMVGYKGPQRYLRAVITVAGATTGGIYSATLIRGDAQQTPAP